MGRVMTYLVNIRIADIIDILIVAFVIYKFMELIKETRAEQLMKGILALFVFTQVTKMLNLYTMQWILDNTLFYGVFSLMIVFQPELRRGLEYIGRSNFLSKPMREVRSEKINKLTAEIVAAVQSLSRQKIGALIVIEQETGLNEIIETGTMLDADISSELLINIFIPNTPLHDGAVVIRGEKIRAAACFLPLTDNKNLSKELGTRHRAGLGVSERSDAKVIIVSEETGAVSIASNGEISRYIDDKTLETILNKIFNKEESGLFGLLGGAKDEHTEEKS